jgi:photosystem II stability/assembly factor-like uncharacterized protein
LISMIAGARIASWAASLALALVAVANSGCHQSTEGQRPQDAASDRGSDAPGPVDAGAGEVAPDAPPDLPPDAPREVAADAPADAGGDAAVDARDAAQPPPDAGPPADAGASDGGCVPVAPPSVRWVNPLPQGNRLWGVWGSGVNDVYAVGENGTILHSADRGQSWQLLASGTAETLFGIWGSAANDVYVVGDHGLILHSADSGRTWTPTRVGVGQGLRAVWGSSADAVYAAGGNGLMAQRIGRGNWASHYQVSRGINPGWNAIFGSGGTVWVVGSTARIVSSSDGGATWNDAPSPPGTDNYISSITGAGGTLYIGMTLTFSGDPRFYYSSNGGASWNPVANATTDQSEPNALASGAGNVYGFGTSGMGRLASAGGTTFATLATGTTQSLNGAWASDAGDVFAVGDAGVILHATSAAGAFAQTPAVTREELLSMWGSSLGDLIATGFFPNIVQSSDRGAHLALRTPTGSASTLPGVLNRVAGGTGDEVYALGNSSVLRSADRGVTWTVDLNVGVNNFHALTINADGVYAAGETGFYALYHKPPGGAWAGISVTGAQGTMADFWSGGGEIWGVGGSDALHAVGGVFSYQRILLGGSAIERGATGSLITVSGFDEISASTDDGATWNLEHGCWPPDQLAAHPAAGTSDLAGICTGGGRTFIVGAGGTLLASRDDLHWTSVPSGTTNGLFDCRVDDDGTLYAVGAGGTILALTFP